ncbi:MAG: hypothetical protein KatS3mg077_2684 [Candidatus Binatia bacterium]|nr:MAG: hypothetical protein KatS3mg077_2684 [Candidatus Binatia bacterium]
MPALASPGSRTRCRTPDASQWHSWQAWDIHCSHTACQGRIASVGGTFVRAGSFQLERTRSDRVDGVVLGDDGTPLATLWARVHRHSLRGYLRAVSGTGIARFVLPAPPGISLTAPRAGPRTALHRQATIQGE